MKPIRKVVHFFDKFEDKVRFRLSRRPIIYAIIGAVGVALIWKGVEDMAGAIGLNGPLAFLAGLIMLLMTGLLVSFFIGDSILISGLNREKKIADKTDMEFIEEQAKMHRVEGELKHIERELDDIRRHQGPRIRL